jgi:hypothetical protein
MVLDERILHSVQDDMPHASELEATMEEAPCF